MCKSQKQPFDEAKMIREVKNAILHSKSANVFQSLVNIFDSSGEFVESLKQDSIVMFLQEMVVKYMSDDTNGKETCK